MRRRKTPAKTANKEKPPDDSDSDFETQQPIITASQAKSKQKKTRPSSTKSANKRRNNVPSDDESAMDDGEITNNKKHKDGKKDRSKKNTIASDSETEDENREIEDGGNEVEYGANTSKGQVNGGQINGEAMERNKEIEHNECDSDESTSLLTGNKAGNATHNDAALSSSPNSAKKRLFSHSSDDEEEEPPKKEKRKKKPLHPHKKVVVKDADKETEATPSKTLPRTPQHSRGRKKQPIPDANQPSILTYLTPKKSTLNFEEAARELAERDGMVVQDYVTVTVNVNGESAKAEDMENIENNVHDVSMVDLTDSAPLEEPIEEAAASASNMDADTPAVTENNVSEEPIAEAQVDHNDCQNDDISKDTSSEQVETQQSNESTTLSLQQNAEKQRIGANGVVENRASPLCNEVANETVNGADSTGKKTLNEITSVNETGTPSGTTHDDGNSMNCTPIGKENTLKISKNMLDSLRKSITKSCFASKNRESSTSRSSSPRLATGQAPDIAQESAPQAGSDTANIEEQRENPEVTPPEKGPAESQGNIDRDTNHVNNAEVLPGTSAEGIMNELVAPSQDQHTGTIIKPYH